MTRVYLDNNATTRVDARVVEKMLPYFSDEFGNASSTHVFGSEVANAVRAARRSVQALLGAAHDHEIVFTSGGTEADNAAILAGLSAVEGRDEIVVSAVEHPAILSLIEHLQQARGLKAHIIGVDGTGRLDMESFRKALGPKTALVSIMWANNETGTLFPVKELADLAHEAGALFHTDAVQAAGKTPIELKSTRIDFLSLSAHKIHGPKGIGALYVRKGTKFTPLIRGGHQERTRRGGTENTPGIIGFGAAAEIMAASLAEEASKVGGLRDRLERRILEEIGDCLVSGDKENRLPNTTNIAFFDIEGEAVLNHLNRAEVAASTGSACTAGSNEPSHVLRAMNVPARALNGAIRFSLSRDNCEADVDRVLEILPGIVAKLRGIAQAAAQAPQPTLSQ
ncbi:cysteine desulfurase NifS [Methylocystis bryophila]|uniref:Cysteine desulfurase n=1 Tax=Methylocystis bryophila TaxID=655015 RepID=A0A1W6MTT9_9HYPH|nr:cysteine desulfurase NifS [Methylocystis bryophila]ARN81033.1 cysteine desulfurase NifS [Methylocystis bryophila]BDV36951.1 cysteine desulfurase [Methylocystis bryophila]